MSGSMRATSRRTSAWPGLGHDAQPFAIRARPGNGFGHCSEFSVCIQYPHRAILILLLGSALVGLVIGPRYNVYMLVCSAPILALVAATAARLSDFGILSSIAITFACLTVNQMAYLLMAWLSMRHGEILAHDPSHYQIRENSQNDVPDEQTHQEHPPSYLSR